MARSRRKYPRPGTMAERILAHIHENPGVSTNGIITALELNPSPARTCLKALLAHDVIHDNPNGDGHHSYVAGPKGRRG